LEETSKRFLLLTTILWRIIIVDFFYWLLTVDVCFLLLCDTILLFLAAKYRWPRRGGG
jgi:hypothetical protein